MSGPTWKLYGPYPGKGTATITVQFAPGGTLTDPLSVSSTGKDPTGAALVLTMTHLSIGLYEIDLTPTTHGDYTIDVLGSMPSGKVMTQSITIRYDVTAT